MNRLELVIFIISEVIFFFYLFKHLVSFKKAFILSILFLIPLYFSLGETTQFLTIDEGATGMIYEPIGVFIPDAPLHNWRNFGLRTTDLSFGWIFYLIVKYVDLSLIFIKMLVKAFHWFAGFLIILLIHGLISKNFISEKNRFNFSIFYFFTALLLPTNALALKVFNYDLLSMLLSICSILFTFSALKKKSYKLAILGIVFSVLAAQEKLSASIVFLFTSSVFSYLCLANSKKYLNAFLSSLMAFGIGISTSFFGFFILAMAKNKSLFSINLVQVLFPLVAWWWPAVRLVVFKDPHLFVAAYSLYFLIGSIFISFIFSVVFFKFEKLIRIILKFLRNLNLILLPVLFLLGVFGTYFVKAYWAPFYPIKEGYYYPAVSFNDVTWHFGAMNWWGHILNYILYSISIFITAIPTAFWGIYLVIVFLILKNRNSKDVDIPLWWEMLLFGSLIMPVVLGLVQSPLVNRYFNLAIFIFCIVILIKLEKVMENLKMAKIVIVTGFVILFLSEVLPFGPLFAPFRPIWDNYSKEYSTIPSVGRVNGTWLGWGEEVMLGGKMIENYCKKEKIDLNTVRIYYNYYGEWIDRKIPNIYPITTKAEYSKLDYFIINRSGFAQSKGANFPAVKPFFTIEYRGFTQAWIFRGDQLRDAGFKF